MKDCGKASRGRYVQGCRCDACRAANTEYAKRRERERAYEEHGAKATHFVDAGPVRQMLGRLYAKGYTRREVERLGVPKSTQNNIVNGHHRSGRPLKRVKRETKDRLAAIERTGERSLSACQRVDGEWMRGWIQEYARHMTYTEMAGACGIPHATLCHAAKGGEVSARTLAAFAVAKERLDGMCGLEWTDYEHTRG